MLRNSSLVINSGYIYGNDVLNLILASGKTSQSVIHNLQFFSNNLYEEAIKINESASISFQNSIFLNTTVSCLIYANSNSKAMFYSSKFERTYGKIAKIENALVLFEFSHFKYISLQNSPIINEKGTLGLIESNFSNIFKISFNQKLKKSQNFLIKCNNDEKTRCILRKLSFSISKKFALSKYEQMIFEDCIYKQAVLEMMKDISFQKILLFFGFPFLMLICLFSFNRSFKKHCKRYIRRK